MFKENKSEMGNLCVLSCQGVSKIFPVYNEKLSWRILLKQQDAGILALQDISITVPKGKFVGILGHNGAGKSTLLRTLGGVYTPTSGKISLDGQLSGLFELGGFGNRYITGREYAKRILHLQGVKGSMLQHYIEDIRDFSELKESFDARIHTYSSGMAARLYFATATALQHDIYLVDEILSVGDEHFQTKCWQRLRERFANGSSGILVTHDWSAVLKLCEEAHILHRGRIQQSGRADKIVQSYLNLPLPDKTIANFCEHNPGYYTAESGKDCEILFDIQLNEDVPVEYSFSIEMLRIGFGWDIVLLNHCGSIASKAGRHTVKTVIPRLPLAPGKYFLNLFLSPPRDASHAVVNGYDIRSWTVGNGIEFIVEGKPVKSTAVLPMNWQYESK